MGTLSSWVLEDSLFYSNFGEFIYFSSVQWLGHVRLFATLWTIARQVPLSI